MINVESIPTTRSRKSSEHLFGFFFFFFSQYSSAPLPSAPTAPSFSPVCICFPRMQLVMPPFPHFPLWCDECFAYAYWVSGSNAKPSLAICFPFAFGTRTIVRRHRIGSRVGFCLRLWGCVSKPVHGCVGVLLHATPQLSSAGDACRCYAAVPPLRWLTHHLQSYPWQHGSQNHSIVARFYRFLTLGVCVMERSWACVNKLHSKTTDIMNKTSQIISVIHFRSFIHRSAIN